MVLSKTQTDLLQRLMSGDSIAASSLRNDISTELLKEGLLTVRTHGSRRSYAAINSVALGKFVESHYRGLRIANKDKLTQCHSVYCSIRTSAAMCPNCQKPFLQQLC